MKKFHWQDGFLILVFLYLFIPIAATTLYSFSTEWNRTVLPEGLTFKWYVKLFSNTQFIESFGRSLFLSTAATVLAIVVMVPAIFMITVYAPKFEKYIQMAVVMVYSFPGVIVAVGLIKAYASSGVPMVLVIIGAYFVSILPFVYQGTRNSLRNINAKSLMEAAEILGATRLEAFRKVIIPNIYPGLLVAALLSFSILFGEFVLVNLIIGSRFETVQIFLKNNLSKSGHLSSAIVFVYFILLVFITSIMTKISRSSRGVV